MAEPKAENGGKNWWEDTSENSPSEQILAKNPGKTSSDIAADSANSLTKGAIAKGNKSDNVIQVKKDSDRKEELRKIINAGNATDDDLREAFSLGYMGGENTQKEYKRLGLISDDNGKEEKVEVSEETSDKEPTAGNDPRWNKGDKSVKSFMGQMLFGPAYTAYKEGKMSKGEFGYHVISSLMKGYLNLYSTLAGIGSMPFGKTSIETLAENQLARVTDAGRDEIYAKIQTLEAEKRELAKYRAELLSGNVSAKMYTEVVDSLVGAWSGASGLGSTGTESGTESSKSAEASAGFKAVAKAGGSLSSGSTSSTSKQQSVFLENASNDIKVYGSLGSDKQKERDAMCKKLVASVDERIRQIDEQIAELQSRLGSMGSSQEEPSPAETITETSGDSSGSQEAK